MCTHVYTDAIRRLPLIISATLSFKLKDGFVFFSFFFFYPSCRSVKRCVQWKNCSRRAHKKMPTFDHTHERAHTPTHTSTHTHTWWGGSSLKRDGQTGFWQQIATLEQLLSKQKRHRPQTRTRTSTWTEREGYREREWERKRARETDDLFRVSRFLVKIISVYFAAVQSVQKIWRHF